MPDDFSPDSLIQPIRAALDDRHPIALLSLASSLAAALEPQPWPSTETAQPELPPIDEFIGMLTDPPTPETAALATVLARFQPDELLRARTAQIIREAGIELPAWLRRIDSTRVSRGMQISHVIGDSVDLVLELEFPGNYQASLLALVDFNSGIIVTDAFLTDRTIAQLTAELRAQNEPDTSFERLRAVDVATRIHHAIDFGRRTIGVPETDSWPSCRPVAEWMLTLIGTDGADFDFPRLDDAGIEQVVQGFVDSPAGADFASAEDRDALATLLRLASDYGDGSPWRWSEARIEIMLVDLLPRKIIADDEYMLLLPRVLAAFVPYAHEHSGIPEVYTRYALQRLHDVLPHYLAQVHDTSGSFPGFPHRSVREELEQAVGGPDVLAALDAEPLPEAEPLDLTGAPDDVHDRVRNTDAIISAQSAELVSPELLTVTRRLLARIAKADPQIFRRRSRDETGAAAVIWIAAAANDLLDPWSGTWNASRIMKEVAGGAGSPRQRAQPMLNALRVPAAYAWDASSAPLGDPGLLTSLRRATIIVLRDSLVE